MRGENVVSTYNSLSLSLSLPKSLLHTGLDSATSSLVVVVVVVVA